MIPRLLLSVLIFLAAPYARAFSEGTERATRLGLDARTLGLGSVGAGLADDTAAALSSNPALLSSLSRGQIVLFHAPLFEGTRYEAFSLSLPTLNRGSFGLSYTEIRTPDVETRDGGNFLLGTFTYSERQLALAWAGPLPVKNLHLGLTGSWHQMSMDGVKGDSFNADLGLLYAPPGKSWAVGLSSRSLVDSGLMLASERESLPRGILLGASKTWKAVGGIWTTAGETRWLEGEGLLPAVGLEYQWRKTAALRGGWDGHQFSAGAGLSGSSWSAQYALSVQNPAGLTHRVSAGWRFGKDLTVVRLDRKSREDQLKAEILGKLKAESISSYLKNGDHFLAGRQFEEARAEFNKILAWDPQNSDAQDRLRKTTDLERKNLVTTKMTEARRMVTEGNDLDAMVLFKTVLETEPKNAPASKGLEDARRRMRAASRKAFGAASSLPPAEAQRVFEEGLDLYAAGRYSQALDKWKNIVAADPIQRQIFNYVSRAQVRLESNQAQAEQKQKSAVRANKIELLKRQAFESYRKGDLKAAIGAWNEVLSADPQNAEAKSEIEKAQKELQESRKRGVRW